MTAVRKWTCPSCGKTRATRFCPSCGEEPLRPRDLKVDDWAGQMLKTFSSVDGRLLRSFRALLTRPGTLTTRYVAGQRRRYLNPLQLFLLANGLFFAIQSLTHFNIFSSTLDSHLTQQDWSPLAGPLVAERLRATGRTLADYAPLFDRAAVLHAKALIILMALALVPFLPVAFWRARRPFGAHVVYALHLYAFILLLLCVSLLLAEVHLLAGGAGLASPRVDLALSVFNIAACAAYICLSIGPAYGARGAARIVQAIALACIVGAIALGYRFTIFLITLYTS